MATVPWCPSCGEFLNSADEVCTRCPPGGIETVHWEGDLVVIPSSAVFSTRICLFCAGREHVKVWDKESKTPEPWTLVVLGILALFLCPLMIIAVIVYAVRKNYRFRLPRCEPCRDRMSSACHGSIISATAAFVFLPIGSAIAGGFAADSPIGVLLGGAGGLVAAFILLWVVQVQWIFKRAVTVKRADADAVVLRLPDPEATREALRAMKEPA
jgi:hypothetical protein